MPIQINIEKAKNIFYKNLEFSVKKEKENIQEKIKAEGNNRLQELIDFLEGYVPDLSDVENTAQIDSRWPEILPFFPSEPLFHKIYKDYDLPENIIAGCELLASPFETTKIISAFNISFIINNEGWNYKFIPWENLLNPDKQYNYFYGKHHEDFPFMYSIIGDKDIAEEEQQYTIPYPNKRILLQKEDNSVIMITPINLRIDLEELTAKLTFIPNKNEWAYHEIFDIDELPSQRYRDSWELIGHE